MTRTRTSSGPPAGAGTMPVTGRDGKFCAIATPEAASPYSAKIIKSALRPRMVVLLDCVTLATQLEDYTATVIAEFPIWLYLHRTGPMARKINWDNQFGRRLKLRDLHVFL